MAKRRASKEIAFHAVNGWAMLVGLLAYAAAVTAGAFWLGPHRILPWYLVFMIVSTIVWAVCLIGFFIVNPNMSRVLVLFGKYRGTVRDEGFYWTNPFTVRTPISLKAHNIASEKIKVNDLLGNPIEIGAVVVWQVQDTAQAAFDVESYNHYVDVQIEGAIRQLAKSHPYDDGQSETEVISLRGDTEEVTQELQEALQHRLSRAGIEVLEARVTHLAYAPEIASAMLQRQQAAAIISARQTIVEGAVSIVEHALSDLSRRQVLELDDERRATLVGNLLVVLCGHASPQPVLNTGSLYT
jgi:hypothetical protein